MKDFNVEGGGGMDGEEEEEEEVCGRKYVAGVSASSELQFSLH